MKRVKTLERPGWDARAEALGFTWRHLDGARYWDERAYYQFSLAEIEDGIEEPARALHALCLDLVDEVAGSEALMARLAIPEASRDDVANSWKARAPSLYGRFDFAYDGTGPAKLFEYNADTPTSIYETGTFQWIWLEEMIAAGRLPADTDQFNSLHEQLQNRFKAIFPAGGFVHFASDEESVEDRQTVRYLEDIAIQAARNFRALRERGITVRKTIDTVIATRCIASGLTLLYSDKDFDPFVEHLGLRSAMPGS